MRIDINTVDQYGNHIVSTTGKNADDVLDRHFSKLMNRIDNAQTSKTALRYIEAMESALDDARSKRLRFDESSFRYQIADARRTYEELVADERDEQWERRSEKLWDAFDEEFSFIINWKFDNVQFVHLSKKPCMDRYSKLVALANQYNKTSEVMEGIRNRLAAKHLSYMLGPGTFERLLDNLIALSDDTLAEKLALCERILNAVKTDGPLKQHILLNQHFPAIDPKKVKSCYEYLIDQQKLTREKTGGVYVVDVSSSRKKSSASKVSPTKASPGKATATKSTLVKASPSNAHPKDCSEFPDTDALLHALLARHIPHVDKRSLGGCLWIERTQEHAAFLDAVTVSGKRLSKPMTSPKHFDGRPCHWIK